MSFAVSADPAPLRLDASGVVRIGQTRVTLDTLVECYAEGLTAEAIADQYPSLSLGDIYAAIGYYLNHQEDVEAYLAERRREGDEIRRDAKSRHDQRGLRERLLARKPTE